jgi:hypothetical protein
MNLQLKYFRAYNALPSGALVVKFDRNSTIKKALFPSWKSTTLFCKTDMAS